MEWLDIVDEQGNPTGKQVEWEIVHTQGIRHREQCLKLVENGGIKSCIALDELQMLMVHLESFADNIVEEEK